MRRIAMTALVLLPVLAQAQARQTSTTTAAQASGPSTLQAKVTPPAALRAAVAAPAAAPAPAAAAADGSDTLIPVHENIIERTNPDDSTGTLSYTILGGDPIVAARLLKTTPIVLSLKDLRSGDFDARVIVQMTVARDGSPREFQIVRSGGDALNKRALDAVKQYRFKPATQNGLAVDSTVTVEIKVQQS